MVSKTDIVIALSTDKVVEKMVQNIAHQTLSPELKDLCQMVYLILLEYDESKLQDLWENHQMNFFLARIIINQFRSSNSPFHMTFRRFQEKSVDITGMDWEDEN